MNVNDLLHVKGLLQDGDIGKLLRRHFPDATATDLYSAGLHFDNRGELVALSCKGRKVPVQWEIPSGDSR